MTTHLAHPGIDDREEFLVDGCPRCAEYVEKLGVDFDPGRFRAFWAKMIRVEFDNAEAYASGLDRDLGRRLYWIALALQRAFAFDPSRFQAYHDELAALLARNLPEADPS